MKMQVTLLTICWILTTVVAAQDFTEVSGTPFDGVQTSSCAFADVDGDGDDDLLITGLNSLDEPIAKLYNNDGGNFVEMQNTPFDGVETGSVTFSDINNDNNLDVLITGVNSSGELIAKLYTNDGASFTEVLNTPFDGLDFGTITFSDIDGDGDNDLLLTGRTVAVERISKLYTNDGGNFTEVLNTPFDGVASGSVAFSDVDGDGDEDVLITGLKSSGERIAKLYSNEGGNFTLVTGTPFDGVTASSIAFSDVDGDGDDDVVITGLKAIGEQISKLYTNEGGVFTEVQDTPFDRVDFSSIAFSDVDNDGDEDLLITGHLESDQLIAKLYANDGGDFTERMNLPFDGVGTGSVAFSDVDSDGNEDILITGFNNSGERIAKLYANEGVVSSINKPTNGLSFGLLPFPNPSKATQLYVDYNSVGNGELIISVYQINGRLTSQQKMTAESGKQILSIDVSSLNKGNYFLRVDDGNRRAFAKFVVE